MLVVDPHIPWSNQFSSVSFDFCFVLYLYAFRITDGYRLTANAYSWLRLNIACMTLEDLFVELFETLARVNQTERRFRTTGCICIRNIAFTKFLAVTVCVSAW